MAHFARIENNIVVDVITIDNDNVMKNGVEDEETGIAYCNTLTPGTWVQTSYSGSKRKNFAGIGDTYDPVRDAFISPKPLPSFVLDEDTCRWKYPVEVIRRDGYRYEWNEEEVKWNEIEMK